MGSTPTRLTIDTLEELRTTGTGGGGGAVNITQVAGTTVGATAAAALPVELFDGTNPLGTSANPLRVASASSTTGGLLTASGTIGATATAVKASAGTLSGWYIFNSNSAAVYCQLFDLATGGVTLGTTAPKLSFGIPAGLGANILGGQSIQFSTAITIAFTTTRSGAGAPTNTVDYNFFYD